MSGEIPILKLQRKVPFVVRYFLSIFFFFFFFFFSPNDSSLKTMENVFYVIEKALLVLKIFKF